MAVAAFKNGPDDLLTRQFDPPKRASLRAWYNAATKGFADAPKYDPCFEAGVLVDELSIIFDQPHWTLFIARKRNAW